MYADGILLSNLLGNGASFTPRWGLVTPEEIERVDVLYGPFSAAYPGNSVGAVVDYVTRMPDALELRASLTTFVGGLRRLRARHETLSAAGRPARLRATARGDTSWWVNFNRLDSDSHPIAYANKAVLHGTPGTGGVPVTGARRRRATRATRTGGC